MFSILLFAAITCPAVTTPTVRGALGEVQLKVTRPEKAAGYLCQFTSADSELTVEVSTLASSAEFKHFADAACASGQDVKPLKGIGNEAVACTVGQSETIASRVRNQAFLLRLTKSTRDTARDLAEIVAGNLF